MTKNINVSKDLEKTEKSIEKFEESIKDNTLDKTRSLPVLETEPQTKISQKEMDKSSDIYLKPTRTIGSKEQFNEKFRSKFEFDKEYVYFIGENKEIIGESIQFWTKPYPGVPAQEWIVPVNKPVWAPRYVAEQMSRKCYTIFKSEEKTITSEDGMGTYHGHMVSEQKIPRITATPATKRKSIFMGANDF